MTSSYTRREEMTRRIRFTRESILIRRNNANEPKSLDQTSKTARGSEQAEINHRRLSIHDSSFPNPNISIPMHEWRGALSTKTNSSLTADEQNWNVKHRSKIQATADEQMEENLTNLKPIT